MAHCRKTQLSVFLTHRCNLQCIYCYVGDKERDRSVIDYEFVKIGILDFFQNYDSREIRLFATGEPTLEFDLMRKIRDYAFEQAGEDCRFELQTNGFFSTKIAEWISENIDIVWISCDGPSEIQNYYRPTPAGRPSSDIVEKNIRYLAMKPIVLGCRATIGARNVEKQREMIEYFVHLGVRVIMSDPMFAPVKKYSGQIVECEVSDLREYAEHFLEARRYAIERGVFYGSILTVNFDEETEYFCRSCIPYPHLTIDGYVSACDMAFCGTDSGMKDLIYGRYIPEEGRIEYDQEKIKLIKSRSAQNMPHCQGCPVLKNCAGACLGEALNETGSIFGIKPHVCEVIRYLAKRMPLNQGLYPYLHP